MIEAGKYLTFIAKARENDALAATTLRSPSSNSRGPGDEAITAVARLSAASSE